MNRKKNSLTPVGNTNRVLQRGNPAGPFNIGWYNLPVLRGALAPVPRTRTKGWAFRVRRAAPAREPRQQVLPDQC